MMEKEPGLNIAHFSNYLSHACRQLLASDLDPTDNRILFPFSEAKSPDTH